MNLDVTLPPKNRAVGTGDPAADHNQTVTAIEELIAQIGPAIPEGGAAAADHGHTLTDLDATGVPAGQVPTADGAGGATWATPTGGTGGSVAWGDVTDKPTEFPAEAHTHDDRYVRTINGVGPDGSGNVDVEGGTVSPAETVLGDVDGTLSAENYNSRIETLLTVNTGTLYLDAVAIRNVPGAMGATTTEPWDLLLDGTVLQLDVIPDAAGVVTFAGLGLELAPGTYRLRFRATNIVETHYEPVPSITYTGTDYDFTVARWGSDAQDTTKTFAVAYTVTPPPPFTQEEADARYSQLGHTHPAAAISDSTATGRSVLTAATAAAARTAIGAGTSNLALGTTASTAAAGNHTHTAAQITDLGPRLHVGTTPPTDTTKVWVDTSGA